MKIPTMQVTKDGATIRVNEADLEQWQAQGWQEPKPVEPPAPPEKPTKKTK